MKFVLFFTSILIGTLCVKPLGSLSEITSHLKGTGKYFWNWRKFMGCLRKRKAFTLTELLVVVLVIGVLAGVAVPKFKRVLETRKTEEAIHMLGEVRREQEQRCVMGNRYWGEDKKNKVAVLANASTSKNYTYTLTNQGAVATAKGGNYTLQIPSYKEGVVCCSGDGCAALNKSYPNCNELAATVDECVAEVEVPETPEPLATCEPYSWTSSFEIGSGASWGTCYTSHNVTCSETNEEIETTYSNGCVCRTSGYVYISGSNTCVAPAVPEPEEQCEEGVANGGSAGGMADTCDGNNSSQYSCDGAFKGSCTDVYSVSVSGTASSSVSNASWWLPSDSFASFQQGILLAVGPSNYTNTSGCTPCTQYPGYCCSQGTCAKNQYGGVYCHTGTNQQMDATLLCTADQIVFNGRCVDKVPFKDGGGIKDWDPDDPFIPNDPVVPTDPTPVVSYSYRTVTCCGTGADTPEDPNPVVQCDNSNKPTDHQTKTIANGSCQQSRDVECNTTNGSWVADIWITSNCTCNSGYTWNSSTSSCQTTPSGGSSSGGQSSNPCAESYKRIGVNCVRHRCCQGVCTDTYVSDGMCGTGGNSATELMVDPNGSELDTGLVRDWAARMEMM